MKQAVAALLRKIREDQNGPHVGDNTLKQLAGKDGSANSIEVTGRIRSFERIAQKYQIRYHIEKEVGIEPPKWTVYFKASQADALTAAFKEYTRKELAREGKPSLLKQLAENVKELGQNIVRPKVRNKEHGGPEL